jgi:hypothetical protein
MKINLAISEPEELDNGVYKTTFSHPLLEGELFLVHSKNNLKVTLSALENSIAEDIKEILAQIQDLKK